MNTQKWYLNWNLYLCLLGVVAALAVWLFLNTDTPRLALFWLFGLAFGFIVQRSRFCFVSAISNFVLFRDGRLLKGVFAGLIVSTIGFAVIMSSEVSDPTSAVPATAYLAPFGWHLVLAGLLFGLGMVLAGGCLMGTLYRLGEGTVSALVSLVGVIIGMGILQHNYPTWNNYISGLSPLWLPQHLGWAISIILTIVALLALYALICWLQRRNVPSSKTSASSKPLAEKLKHLPKAFFVNSWPLAIGGILFGLVNIWMYVSVERACGFTGEVMRWAQIVMDALHIPAAPLGTIPGS